jgi:integration host factor subunit alpha
MPSKNKYSTTKDLAKSLSKETKISLAEAKKIVDSYFGEIKKKLLKDEPVRLAEFGFFDVTKWESKEIYDINTNSKIQRDIKTIHFRPSEKIKKEILED